MLTRALAVVLVTVSGAVLMGGGFAGAKNVCILRTVVQSTDWTYTKQGVVHAKSTYVPTAADYEKCGLPIPGAAPVDATPVFTG